MFISETQIRVRYGETDQMGYVYYGNYALYYEVARVEALRKAGTSYRQLEESGIMLPVLEVHSKFIRPGRYDDLLTLTTYMKELPSARIRFEVEIRNEAAELIHTGDVTLAFVDMKTNKPIRCPSPLLESLRKYFT
jgi:acyl-CoA thioester hydrolase